MKKRNIVFLTAAAVIILSGSVKSASAYFTTYVSAVGSKEVVLGDRTEIKEEIKGIIKNITISADEDSEPVWVRVRAYSPDEELFPVSYNFGETPDPLWTKGEDGWWYYANPIANNGDDTYKEETSTLKVSMTLPETKPDGTPLKPGDTFNLVVVYECTPVLYREETLEPYADWGKAITVHETEQGAVVPVDPDNGSGTGEGTETGGNNG